VGIFSLQYEFDWGILFTEPYLRILIDGVSITLLIFVISSAASLFLGTVIAILRVSRIRLLQALGILYVKVFQSIPVLFWMLFFFYVLPEIFPIGHGEGFGAYFYYPVIAGSLALTLDNASYVSDILRSGRLLIPPIQRDVAIATGLNRVQQYLYVLLPQMFRLTLSPLGTRMVHNFKNTTLCMAITAHELIWATQQVESLTLRGVEAIIMATVFYIVLSLIMASAVILLARRLKIDAAAIMKSRV